MILLGDTNCNFTRRPNDQLIGNNAKHVYELFSFWQLVHEPTNVRFQFRVIQVKEVRDTIAQIKPSKSFGKENISCHFLKLALPFIENCLGCLFHTSIEIVTRRNKGYTNI